MALVTYTGRASRIRISDGTVLERLVGTEVPNDVARGLKRSEFDVVMPTRRPPASRSTTKRKTGRTRTPKKES